MDQNSSSPNHGARGARNGAAKARNAKAINAKSISVKAISVKARNAKADSAPAKPRAGKALGNGHADAAELDQHELLNALHAMQAGDFSVRLPGHQTGVAGKICDAFNTIVAANQRIAQQLEHVGEVVGHQGKPRTGLRLGPSDAAWATMEGSVIAPIDARSGQPPP